MSIFVHFFRHASFHQIPSGTATVWLQQLDASLGAGGFVSLIQITGVSCKLGYIEAMPDSRPDMARLYADMPKHLKHDSIIHVQCICIYIICILRQLRMQVQKSERQPLFLSVNFCAKVLTFILQKHSKTMHACATIVICFKA